MKESTSERRRNRREAITLMIFVLCVHSCFKLLGWGSQDLSWWQVILVAPVSGAIYWALCSTFRKFAAEFAPEDVTAQPHE
ncbi:hypothetical protein [Brevibacterium sp. RIT 803]|uniref:hypothetical protein n=1 Tax=Brevibacterium sp. RIT 803 TaxID=2810210 RepID=UPI0019516162|nr:hypothetical protein [Brevibacterium sp. RIT 803]MBM6591052.1 hypothetical protein [Brevibacterium sp. RIT 803]